MSIRERFTREEIIEIKGLSDSWFDGRFGHRMGYEKEVPPDYEVNMRYNGIPEGARTYHNGLDKRDI